MKLVIVLPEDTHRRLKAQAALSGRTMTALVHGLIDEYLDPPQKMMLPELSPSEKTVVGEEADWDWDGAKKVPPSRRKAPDLSKSAQAKGKMGR